MALKVASAARSLGQSHWNIITRHLLPNVMHLVLINFVLGFSNVVLTEAILSYLGVGTPIGTASWGQMIDGARGELSRTLLQESLRALLLILRAGANAEVGGLQRQALVLQDVEACDDNQREVVTNAEVPALKGSGAEVLNQDVGGGEQVSRELLAALLTKVEGD